MCVFEGSDNGIHTHTDSRVPKCAAVSCLMVNRAVREDGDGDGDGDGIPTKIVCYIIHISLNQTNIDAKNEFGKKR